MKYVVYAFLLCLGLNFQANSMEDIDSENPLDNKLKIRVNFIINDYSDEDLKSAFQNIRIVDPHNPSTIYHTCWEEGIPQSGLMRQNFYQNKFSRFLNQTIKNDMITLLVSSSTRLETFSIKCEGLSSCTTEDIQLDIPWPQFLSSLYGNSISNSSSHFEAYAYLVKNYEEEPKENRSKINLSFQSVLSHLISFWDSKSLHLEEFKKINLKEYKYGFIKGIKVFHATDEYLKGIHDNVYFKYLA